MEATRQLGVSVLRWPGGNFVSGYQWKDGIGPKDQRPVRPDHAWGGVESNRFGTDEFLQYCETAGLTPYICINAGLGSINDARDWLEYTNETRKTYWADQRRKNDREKPWDVKIPRRSREMTHLCSFRVTHVKNRPRHVARRGAGDIIRAVGAQVSCFP